MTIKICDKCFTKFLDNKIYYHVPSEAISLRVWMTLGQNQRLRPKYQMHNTFYIINDILDSLN